MFSSANADRWTNTDTAIQLGVGVTLLGDYLQTRRVMRDNLETNYFMRTYATDKPPILSPEFYFSAVAIVHTLTMITLPKTWRHVAQGLTIGVQLKAMRANYAYGYRFSF